MLFGKELENISKQLIRDHGETLDFFREEKTKYNPATGKPDPIEISSEEVVGAITSFKEKLVDGQLIQKGDKKIIIGNKKKSGEPLSKVPSAGDIFKRSSQEFKVISVNQIISSGITTVYICHVRN